MSVTPSSGSVVLGNQLTFMASVSNATDTSVGWTVNGIAGGNSAAGTISSTGVYTAPVDLPFPAVVQVTATSHADPTKSAIASVTVTSDITLSLTPNPASVELGATQRFQGTITSSGHPDTTTRWSLSGAACLSACATVDSNGTFTAPGILPSPASVTLTAPSVADPSKQISAAVTITSNFALQLSAPSSVPAGASTTIVAALTPLPNSNPNTVLAWSLSGAGCSSSSCGVLSVTTTQSTGEVHRGFRNLHCPRHHHRPGRAAARGNFRRLGMPRACASTDGRRKRRRPMEHQTLRLQRRRSSRQFQKPTTSNPC